MGPKVRARIPVRWKNSSEGNTVLCVCRGTVVLMGSQDLKGPKERKVKG